VRHIITATLLAALAGHATAETIYDSGGFETFAEGLLDGQDGWYAGWFAMDPYQGIDPVIQDLGAANGGKAIAMRGFAGGAAFAGRTMPELFGQGYAVVTVSFDILRPSGETPPSQLAWFGCSEPEPGIGEQASYYPDDPNLPLVQETYPFGRGLPWDPNVVYPSAPTVYDRWANLTLTWDTLAGLASAWYDGAYVGSVALGPNPQLPGWEFDLGGDDARAYIDNFTIEAFVPEPQAALMLLTCAALSARRAHRRRRASPVR